MVSAEVDAAAVLRSVWPGGVPDEEQRLFGLLSPERQQQALARMKVLRAIELKQMPVGEGAAAIGMGRSSFHDLRLRWQKSRSIASITPHVGRRVRQARVADEDAQQAIEGESAVEDPLTAAALQLTESNARLSNGAIAKLLMEQRPGEVSRPTATKIIQRLRRAARLRPEYLQRAYGEQLLMDVTGVAMLIEEAGAPSPAIGVFVIERASGLILACSVGRRSDALQRQRQALGDASLFLREHVADRSLGTETQLRIVLADGAAEGGDVKERLFDKLGKEAVLAVGPRRFGKLLTSTLGVRIGRIELRTQSTPEGGPLPSITIEHLRNPISEEDANGLLRDYVKKHNAPILQRLKKVGLIGQNAVAAGAMAAALDRAAEAFR